MLWSVAVLDGSTSTLSSMLQQNIMPYTQLNQTALLDSSTVTDVPAGFIADPFLFYWNNVWYIFTEILHNLCQKGEIGK